MSQDIRFFELSQRVWELYLSSGFSLYWVYHYNKLIDLIAEHKHYPFHEEK